MAETTSKIPVKTAASPETAGAITQSARQWHPFDSLHSEIDRIFEDFDRSFGLGGRSFGRSLFDMQPAWRTESTRRTAPAVDIAEREKDYEITAELPGMDAASVDIKVANGNLVIRGEKKDEREGKTATSYISERSYGLFERSFRLPEGTDTDKIAASFSKGVLTVHVPKTSEAQKSAKKIEIKTA